MTDSATPSRALTPPEIDELKSSLKSHLRLHNSPCAFQAEADADDLLNYALDMIEDGNNVNSVCEELNFMEMSICDEEVLEEVRHELTQFIGKINKGGKKNWRDNNYLTAGRSNNNGNNNKPTERKPLYPNRPAQASSPPPRQPQAPPQPTMKKWEPEEVVADDGSVDVPVMNDDEPSEEEEEEEEQQQSQPPPRPKLEPPKKTGNYLIDQMAMEEYKEKLKAFEKRPPEKKKSMPKDIVETTKQTTTRKPLYDNKKPKKTGNYLIDKLNAEREASRTSSVTSRVTPLYEDRSALPPPLVDQPLQPHEKRLVNLPSTESQRDQAALRGTELERELMESENYVSKDFGAKAAADKNKREMESIFGAGGGQGAPVARKASSLKDKYQQSLIADKVDNKKKAAMWSAGQGDTDDRHKFVRSGTDKSNDSCDSNMMALISPGFNEPAGRWSSRERDESENDAQRRSELQALMRDKSLSKDERRKRMDEVRAKYGGGAGVNLRSSRASTANPPGLSSLRDLSSLPQYSRTNNSSPKKGLYDSNNDDDDGVDEEYLNSNPISAKQAALKSKREMESLFGKSATTGPPKASSLKDRYQQSLTADKVENKKKAAMWSASQGADDRDELVRGGSPSRAANSTIRDAAASSSSTPAAPDASRRLSVDQIRREEMMAIMKDKSLNKEEKAAKMEEVKAKYDASSSDGGYASTDGGGESSISPQYNSDVGPASPPQISGSAAGTTDNAVAREMSEEETNELRSVLKSHLRLHNSACAFQAEADAEDLLNYALDMFEDGESVDHVCEEVGFMEMSICDDDVLEKIREELDVFLVKLQKAKKKNWRENNYLTAGRSKPAAGPVMREVKPTSEDPPRPTPAPAQPKLDPPKKTGNYLIDQMAMDEYKERLKEFGRSSSTVTTVDSYSEERSSSPPTNGSSSSQSSLDAQRRAELQKIMRDKSLNKEERRVKMDEIKDQYAALTVK